MLPINYLAIGAQKSKAVGRLRFMDVAANSQAMATGFLISPDLILTNHHVFQAADSFQGALIDFDYAYDVTGQEMGKVVFTIDPNKFFYTFEGLDFSLVGIQSKDQTSTHAIGERGYLVLNPGIGKAGMGDAATIIQYPDGNYQQVGLRDNAILDISDPNTLIYKTDTSPGTSGSPVFNDQGQVIALHSAGVAKKNEQGDYIDQNGAAIPVVDGKIDSARVQWISNAGIRVSALMNHLKTATDLPTDARASFISFLFSTEYSDEKQVSKVAQPIAQESNLAPVVGGTVINDPATLTTSPPLSPTHQFNRMTPQYFFPNNTGTVNITVHGCCPEGEQSTRRAKADAASSFSGVSETGVDRSPLEATEAKLVATDFADCQGFKTKGFLTIETPLPSLSKDLLRQSVYLTDNPKSNVLNYFYYSTIQHAIRKMPIVSAINVEGNLADRQDTSKRVDKWMQDDRIDLTVQLTNAYYSKSGFDKGHMSRREDADYGTTAQVAEQAANMTCMLTNACPQVPKLNRSPGLWGELEKIVLEQGARLETGVESKICVYNGPVFVDSDPVYQGVQVPLRFFKIVVWLNGQNQQKTTAFILSQEDLVGGIQFEELDFNKQFVEHQCSVVYLEGLTGLTFDRIRDWDTYVDPNHEGPVKPLKPGDLESLLQEHV